MTARLDNAAARRLFLDRHALLDAPTGTGRGDDLHALIARLGFVQVDSVSTVARAHHMILHARRTAYRPAALTAAMERDRRLFEHWTHDAAILPVETWPHWQHRCARDAATLTAKWSTWRRAGYEQRFAPVLDHIAASGACRSDAFDDRSDRTGEGWWDWHPSKTALEYLWRTGQLAVAARQGFRKVYDLPERVIPDRWRGPPPPLDRTIDWANDAAMTRLGIATPGEIAAFWAFCTPAEARTWCEAGLAAGRLEQVAVEMADGTARRMLARPGTVEAAHALPPAPGMIRVLSPFDPMIRDRKRAERLFGFHYRIEIFVPAEKRRFGYYVFPLLEGARLIGRIDMAADRAADALHVTALWPEPGLRFGATRRARLDAALARTARLAGVADVTYAPDWLRPAG